jgi:Protein of unknown function (DUF664)
MGAAAMAAFIAGPCRGGWHAGNPTHPRGGQHGPTQATRWVYLHVLRELARHGGHAGIPPEQLINEQGITAGAR